MVDSSDKRDFRRMSVDCPVAFKVIGSNQVINGKVMDLSATGLRIHSAVSLEAGDEIEVNVKPEKTYVPPLYAIAEVLRVDLLDSGNFEIACKILEMKS